MITNCKPPFLGQVKIVTLRKFYGDHCFERLSKRKSEMPFTGLYVSRVKNGTLSNLDYVTGDLCQAAIFARDLVETFSVCYYFSGNYLSNNYVTT